MIARALGPGSSVMMCGVGAWEAGGDEGTSMVVMSYSTPDSERRVLPAHLG
jgi:hypothetical protein